MAIIGKIREKSALIVIIVGLALLAFVLSDWQKISGQTENPYGYGTVYGEKIDFKKFNDAKTKFEQMDQMQLQQSGKPYTPEDQEASEDKAWNYVVENEILEGEFNALGIDIDEEEFEAYLYGDEKVGFSPLPQLAQSFTDSATGKYNPNLLKKRITEMENSEDPKVQADWLDYKNSLMEDRRKEKYYNIVSQGVYVTKLEAEDEYFAQKEVKNISFVVKRFDQIPDAEIKVSDSDMQAYYEKHKEDKKYQVRENARDLRYFDISIKPSKTDSNNFNNAMQGIIDGFKSSANDSLYVMKNSDVKFYASSKLATAVPIGNEKEQSVQQRYPQYLDTTFKSAAIGQVVGPYDNGTNIVVSKVIGFTPTRLKARHILLKTDQGADKIIVDKKQKMADSLLVLINKTNFEEFVKKYSDDQGSVPTGGLIDNFLEAQMVPEFGEFCATKPIGTIGTVKTMYGIHIIEVLERDDTKFPVLASVQKSFKPSADTKDFLESDVYDLIENKIEPKISAESSVSKKIALFDTLAKKSGYDVKMLSILENSPKLYGFNTSSAEEDLLNLAFSEGAMVGDITTSPIKDKDRYIIAIVSSIRKKGVPNFEDVETEMRRDLIKEKKAERIKSEMAKYKDLNSLASGLGLQVMNADVNFSAGQINGVGPEPTVVGSIFSGLKDGQRTTPLVGDIGVYVIRIDKTTQAPAAPNYETERKQILSGLRSNSRNEIYLGLRDKANVIDNRRFFNAGILFERED
jgi:peptidyl-prolyl cis-trans isomerase D